MRVYKGKFWDLWKQQQYAGSKVKKIKTINELEEIISNSNYTIHQAFGDGSVPFVIEEIEKQDFSYLRTLLKNGLVSIHWSSYLNL